MNALGYAKELTVAVNHKPARFNARSLRITTQPLDELGDASSTRRGVNVDHGSALKAMADCLRRLCKRRASPLVDERNEQVGRPRGYLDLQDLTGIDDPAY